MQKIFVLMFTFYLVQAFCISSGLPSLPIAFYLKEVLGFQAQDLATFQALVYSTWMIKPVFGLIADSFYLLGYQTKSYLVVCFSVAPSIINFEGKFVDLYGDVIF